jgi:hypothetical protein
VVGKAIVDLNADQADGLRRMFAHADHHSERVILSAAIVGVMKRPINARGADIAFALLQRAVNIDRRQGRVGPSGHFNAMPDVAHNERELADAETQRQLERLEISKTTSRYDLLLGLTGAVSQEEFALLEAIDKTFRLALRGHAEDLRAKKTEARDPDIDFQILWWLAAGKSQRKVADHFGIKQQLVNRIKRTRLQTIYREVIEPLMPAVSRPAPKGIHSGTSEPFGGNPVYVADQPYFRPYTPGQNWRSLSGIK